MKQRLQQAGLWDQTEKLTINISTAWHILAQLGYPARYGGRAQDGSHEFLIINPATGVFLATGKGATLEISICDAAINACALANQETKTTVQH